MSWWKTNARTTMMLAAALAVFVALGCEENGTVPEETLGEVEALTVICNPLAPAPGQEAQLTVLSTGRSGTEPPQYRWSVEEGTLVPEEGPSVGWIVPDETGTYHVEVYASLDESADTAKRDVMIRNFASTSWRFAAAAGDTKQVSASYRPLELTGGIASICIGSRWYTTPFYGYHVLINTGTSVSCKTNFQTLFGGNYFSINNAVNEILGSMFMTASGFYRRQRMDVWKFPTLGFGTPVNITRSDKSDESSNPQTPVSRKNQHIYPEGSADFGMVVWQQCISGKSADGTDDEFNIGFSNADRWNRSWSEGQPPTFMTCTRSYYVQIQQVGPDIDTSRVYYKNIRPLITPAEDQILYFVDSTGTFEPCLIPIVGSEPDTLQRRALMVGPDHGIFWVEGIAVSEKTVFQWNPVFELLGFVDNNRSFCVFDPASESVTRFSEIGKIDEFAWSPDGNRLAATREGGISVVNLAGVDRIVFEKERGGDEVFGVNWSNDTVDPVLAFRVVRKGTGDLESFSAIVFVSDLFSDRPIEEKWYYATPRIGWSMEPPVEDYRWLRVMFESGDVGVYASMPVSGVAGKTVVTYRSFE